jgi:hypothetical protein
MLSDRAVEVPAFGFFQQIQPGFFPGLATRADVMASCNVTDQRSSLAALSNNIIFNAPLVGYERFLAQRRAAYLGVLALGRGLWFEAMHGCVAL